MTSSKLEVTKLQLNIGGDPITLTSSLNTLNLQGTGGNSVSLENLDNIKLVDSSNGNSVTLKAPILSSTYELSLPPSLGSFGQVLSLDIAGNLQWTSSGVGDVLGDMSSTNNSIVRF